MIQKLGPATREKLISGQMPLLVQRAFIAAEDRRFYEHDGIDTRGIARALWQDIQAQSIVEGGSTITQQFVKNAYVRNERTLARKVREAARYCPNRVIRIVMVDD